MSANTLSPVGKPLDRVDGRLKVTGGAKYAAEFNVPGVVHAYAVESSIAKGKITAVDTAAAERAPGLLAVLTHLNAPRLTEAKSDMENGGGIRLEERNPLSDDVISYGGQHVAVAVAETFEQARHAARLIRLSYAAETPALTKEDAYATAKRPKENNGDPIQVTKGDVDAALANPNGSKLAQTYLTPTETHNPIEPHATVATWEAPDRLLVYDATQYVKGTQDILAQTFNLPKENVRVVDPFVGGGFGCKGAASGHTILAAMAARVVGRPVKFPLTRASMFTTTSHRTMTSQDVRLAAAPDGKLQAIQQDTECLTSPLGFFVESCGATTANVLYASPAIGFTHTVYTVNKGQSGFMRAPGETPGTFAVESAMDELAYALKMDPVQLRLANYSERHPVQDKPWSTKFLRDAYRVGAEKFGWDRRNPEPRSMREGNLLVGMGMATATYPGYKMAANVRVRLAADGTTTGMCATHDLGTGAYTAFAQITAEAVGVPMEQVRFDLGSSDLPHGPVAGGSNSTAAVGHAIYNAARALHAKLGALGVMDPRSPLRGLNPGSIEMVAPGRLGVKGDPAKTDGFTDLLARAGKDSLEADGAFKPSTPNEHDAGPVFQSFGAQFVEVRIDPDLPRVQVSRVVSVMDCGRIINPKTARSQILGGVVMGLGMALTEETVYDRATGLPVTRNLADYHVPVNADVVSIEPFFVGEPDLAFNPMGARGVGEIGITGVAAAVANAVFHATGKRVRDLPITPDKLLV